MHFHSKMHLFEICTQMSNFEKNVLKLYLKHILNVESMIFFLK